MSFSRQFPSDLRHIAHFRGGLAVSAVQGSSGLEPEQIALPEARGTAVLNCRETEKDWR
jgi:hypothetical protein